MKGIDKNELRSTWNDAFKFFDAHPQCTYEHLTALMHESDRARAETGFLLCAAWHLRADDLTSAIRVFDLAQQQFDELPDLLRVLRLNLHALSDDLPSSALMYAHASFERGAVNQALEEMRIAFTADFRQDNVLGYQPDVVMRAAAHYERVAQDVLRTHTFARSPHTGRIRIGMLVPNLVDHTVAYANRVIFFSRYIDRSAFDLYVYSSEDMARDNAASAVRAPQYFKELQDARVPVFCAPTDVPMRDAAIALASRMAADGIDIVIIQATLAMPVAWLTCRMVNAYAKLHIHIGMALYMAGMYATLYDNAAVMARDSDTWPDYAGKQMLLRRGTDLAAVDETPGVERRALGIPSTALVIGVLSNHLDRRMSEGYTRVLCALMVAHPQVWFMPVGDIKDTATLALFRRKGVIDRVRTIGGQKHAVRFLKAMDIYANEFPSGGSQAVVEAMACGIPVAAMQSAATHHESIGAQIAGDAFAIGRYDEDAYYRLIDTWISDVSARAAAGAAMRERAQKEFSIAAYVQQVLTVGRDVCVSSGYRAVG